MTITEPSFALTRPAGVPRPPAPASPSGTARPGPDDQDAAADGSRRRIRCRVLFVGPIDLRGVSEGEVPGLCGTLHLAPTVAAAHQVPIGPGDVVVAARWADGDVLRFVAVLYERADGPAVLVVSHSKDRAGAVTSLTAGADDHAVWPMAAEELWARIERLRAAGGDAPRPRQVCAGPLVVDLGLAEARLDRVLLPLTPTQYALLVALMEAGGAPVATEDLLQRGWDVHQEATSDLLRPQLARLRRTLGSRFLISSQRGRGYRLTLTEPAPDPGGVAVAGVPIAC